MHVACLDNIISMSLFTRSLWPSSIRAPYRRLCVALVLAPLLVAAILTLFAYLLAGSTAPDGESVLNVTIESAKAILIVVIGFMLTFGFLSVLILWAIAQRGILTWFLTGIIAGGIAGILFGEFAMGGVERGLLLIFAVMGGTLMVLIRAIAGIGDEPDDPWVG